MIEVMLRASFELTEEGVEGNFTLSSTGDDGNEAFGGFGTYDDYWARPDFETFDQYEFNTSNCGHFWRCTYWGVIAGDGEVYFYTGLKKRTMAELIEREMGFAGNNWLCRAKRIKREEAA